MYDSDEVRDAVRRDMRKAMLVMNRRQFDSLSPWEHNTIDEVIDAELAQQHLWLTQFQAAVQELCAAITAWAEKVVQALVEAFRPTIRTVTETLRELAEQSGFCRKRETRPMPWARRPRKPEIRPARPIDAVAAGRLPAMIFRSRRVGGRR